MSRISSNTKEVINNYYNEKIKLKFGDCCSLCCDFKRYLVEYEESNNYKMVKEEIEKIKKERSELFVVLENLPKKSKEYIKALKKLELIVKGE